LLLAFIVKLHFIHLYISFMKSVFLSCLLVWMYHVSVANVRLPSVIADDMVLQQQSSARLWGWSEPEEKIYITTSWNNRTDSVKGTRDGNWMVAVPTPAAGGPYTIRIRGHNIIDLKNVLIGEVWVCSGQSNMEMSGSWGLPDVKSELPVCANTMIRLFHIPKTTSEQPQDDCKASWAVCDSNELKSFSAAAYFFGKRLHQELHVPIGLIEAAWGGTAAEVWTPAGLVNDDPTLKDAAGQLPPSFSWPHVPGRCYNGMIAPIVHFTIAGVLWYQGESNAGTASTYAKLLDTMILSWRKAWEEPLPFYYVQIAPFTYGGANERADLLREQQSMVMRLEHTGMVVISDITGDTTDIHPKNKHDVGYRLAAWALGDHYHQGMVNYKHPSYSRMEVKGEKISVELADAPNGLILKGPVVRALFVAGEDKVFYPAEGKIEGSRLVVSARQVKRPVAVRYQFSNAGVGNVFSKEGLPVAPFRTDAW
jgi:sialate O-acetylesterase